VLGHKEEKQKGGIKGENEEKMKWRKRRTWRREWNRRKRKWLYPRILAFSRCHLVWWSRGSEWTPDPSRSPL